MIKGDHVSLRPVREEDWPVISAWAADRDGLWGPYQRFQLDHLPRLREAFARTGLLSRESAFLMIEPNGGGADAEPVGFVRYVLQGYPDEDFAYPDIGVGVAPAARGSGFATEAIALLVGYLLDGYPVERVAATTDAENLPAQRSLERLGFTREGVLRKASFRDGHWVDLCVYAVLRDEWNARERV